MLEADRPQKTRQRYQLNRPQIILIGFGFLASSLAWSVYNSQVPLILSERFLLSNTLVGTIMTIDNFFGVIFQPLIGAWSDNTRTALGRRLPWILFGLPISALLFALIPLQNVLWAFMAVIVAFNLLMSLWRSPVISLMPDVTPSPLRSQANGIINLMGGLGSIIAFLVGGYLSDLRSDKFFAFLMAALVMVLALVILYRYVREPDALNYQEAQGRSLPNNLAHRWALAARTQLAAYEEELATKAETEEASASSQPSQAKQSFTAFFELSKAYQRSLIAILIAIFAWFMGFNAIETFFTLFAKSAYEITGGQATMMLTAFSLSFLVFALPAGLLGQRLGRKRTILLGLIGIIAMFLPILVVASRSLVQILLIGGGAFWACININSLPMVLEFANRENLGSFTGYYYLFSFTAAIVSPIAYGMIQDYFQTESLLFAFALCCFMAALVSMLFVRHGENQK